MKEMQIKTLRNYFVPYLSLPISLRKIKNKIAVVGDDAEQ